MLVHLMISSGNMSSPILLFISFTVFSLVLEGSI